jgi:hypothetical protein
VTLLALFSCGELRQEAKRLASGAKKAGQEVAPLVEADGPACDARVDSGPARGCLSGVVTCGQTIEGTTVGGDSAFDDAFYASAFCFPAGDRHSASERVYLLNAPADSELTVSLASTCVDLDLAILAWNWEGSCPTENHPIPECEGDATPGGGTVHVSTFNARSYLIAVDGKKGATGPFRLTVECRSR